MGKGIVYHFRVDESSMEDKEQRHGVINEEEAEKELGRNKTRRSTKDTIVGYLYICILTSLLLKQIFKQDVEQNVSTYWYGSVCPDYVSCLIRALSFKIDMNSVLWLYIVWVIWERNEC